MTDQQHVLYRMYDVHDRLLYVGITLDPSARLRAHMGDKPWWPQIAGITLEHFDNRDELEAAEVAAILDEDPLYNVASRPPMGPARPPSRANHTKARQLRIPDDLWKEFGRVAGPRNRASLVIQMIRWYNREPGAKLPARPPTTTTEETAQ